MQGAAKNQKTCCTAGWQAGQAGGDQAAGRVHTGWSPLASSNLAGWFLHQKSAISKLLSLDYIHYQVYF